MPAREAFLQRVRQAVSEGNRAGSAGPLPERNGVGVGCQNGPGIDLVRRFCTELATAGGKSHVIGRPEEVLPRVLEVIASCKARRILLSTGAASLVSALKERSFEVTQVADLTATTCRDPFFQADLGITSATHLLAETGTVVLAASRDEPRSASLLPPVHIVLAHRNQILPDMFDLFALYPSPDPKLPSCLTLITGPSKTGDIELKLVTGVHGPGEVHVVLGTW